jgi:hypothetical protein
MVKLRVIQGGKTDAPGFVCTVCARGYATRLLLEAHWQRRPQCGDSRFATRSLKPLK